MDQLSFFYDFLGVNSVFSQCNHLNQHNQKFQLKCFRMQVDMKALLISSKWNMINYNKWIIRIPYYDFYLRL